MIDFSTLVLFCLSVVGFTNIITDPATIMQPVRDFIEKKGITNKAWGFLDKLVSCYQCTGTWVGFACGFILISNNPFIIFLCGMAGSFVATSGAAFLNYLEFSQGTNVDNE